MNHLEKCKVSVPEGKKGNWSIEKFTVSVEDAKSFNVRASFRDGRLIHEGDYTQLKSNNEVMMSDTPSEIMDHNVAINKAKDHVLINGLGLGMVLQACLLKEEVTHCTVVEIDQDVIDLVEPHYREMFGDKFTIICADALDYKPPRGSRYGMVWHDICADNLPEMIKLKKKYGRRADWQGCWCENIVRRESKRTRW